MFVRSNAQLSAIVALTSLLLACAPAATPAAPTAAPKPTTAPAAAPAATTAPAAAAAAQASPAAQPATAASPAAQPAAAASPVAASKPAVPVATPSGPLTKLVIGDGAASATALPNWISEDLGIFNKYGIDPEGVLLNGGSQVAQALASGSAQVSEGGMGAAMDAEMGGAPLILIGVPYPWQFFQIYAQADIKTPQDLRGKTIGASDPGASSDRAITQAMAKYGMVPGKDFNVTYVGGTEQRVQALQQKVVDAAIISPPNSFVAGKMGFNKVVDLVAEEIPFGYAGLSANAPWAKQNPQLLQGFLKARAEALAMAKANKQIAFDALKKHMNITDPDILQQTYDVSVTKMALLPMTQPDLVKLMLTFSESPKAKTVDPSTLYDNSYLQQIQDSGFLKTLPGQ